MTYIPNFDDPRVISRCKRALGFVSGVMSKTKPRSWSTRYIDKYLGNQRNDLSKYLREKLLICVNDKYKFNVPGEKSICKEYVMNSKGVEYLRGKLKLTQHNNYPIVVEVAKDDHLNELSTGNFEYTDKSNRFWHPLQRYRKQHRTQILADHGYEHQYDIETCAPTLIHQRSQQLGMDLYLFALNKYLKDKTQIREQVSKEIDLPVEAVKEVINALFAGAVISKHSESDIYHILDGDLARIEWLKQDPFIQELVSDIKTCWEYIKPTMQVRTKKTPKGTERRLPINAKQKWHVYFELERRVITSVRSYLDEKSVRYFLLHDGWACDQEVNREELSDYVRDQTGFDLKFEYLKLTQHKQLPYCSGSQFDSMTLNNSNTQQAL